MSSECLFGLINSQTKLRIYSLLSNKTGKHQILTFEKVLPGNVSYFKVNNLLSV